MTGQILGERYEVQRQLGKKAGRRTFLTRDLTTGELVVVKLLTFSSDFVWDDLKLFEREAETLKGLNHPAIPRYLDYFELNSASLKGFALVQTYIPAKTLENHLTSGRTFTEAEVKQIATALLEILIYLHGQNPPVIHRDIKPSNILKGDRSGNSVGKLYLVDFGSVQTVAATEGGTMTVVGTYGYMPPEQFGGRAVPASDVYSLGATLIYLVTGTHPADLPQRDLRIQFEQIANVSPGFGQWLRWMTEPSLDRRCPSVQEALQALEEEDLQELLVPESHTTNSIFKLGKPTDSKILVTKNEEFLEIVVPPRGFELSTVFLGLFATAWNSFILFWTIGVLAETFPVNNPFVLFSLPFWGAGFFMVYHVLSALFERTRLRVDRLSISLSKQILGFKFRRLGSKRDITKLEYIPKHMAINAQGDRVQIPPQLIISVGVQKLIIWAGMSTNHPNDITVPIKSTSEIEWLAQELSDWLAIPITRVANNK
ncbi:MAG: serine/threonine-protein kinase [Nostocaceae cyanobacterium]|nr:serine/threonine-protein kinase [Nostocaceae cyanobacterium]